VGKTFCSRAKAKGPLGTLWKFPKFGRVIPGPGPEFIGAGWHNYALRDEYKIPVV